MKECIVCSSELNDAQRWCDQCGADQPTPDVVVVTELVQGEHLGAVLAREGPLPAARLAHIIGRVCEALAEAPADHRLHGGLTPSNIVFSTRPGDDSVRLLGRVGDAVDNAGRGGGCRPLITGDPTWQSPEQLRGLRPDTRADIYALGLILYQLATGRLPFDGDTPIAIVTKHILEKPKPPSLLRRSCRRRWRR